MINEQYKKMLEVLIYSFSPEAVPTINHLLRRYLPHIARGLPYPGTFPALMSTTPRALRLPSGYWTVCVYHRSPTWT